MKKHWYRFFISFCPVCLSETTVRERHYGKKEKNPYYRNTVWDYCEL